jgi:Lipopolysaccharide biosynthesis proteins, LPS:glycosyltransferases
MNVTGGIGISVPPMRYYCTYFDKNYLLKGLALISSLHAHEPDPFRLYVVCLDELTQELLNRLAIKQVVTVPLADIEAGDSGLASAKQNRSQVEYYWTLTPSVIACLLKRFPLIDVITYLDADLYFFSSTAPIYAALGDSSILIHEHRFSPQLAFLARYGTYNVGLLCFRNNADGLEALSWWRDRCLEWCYQRVEDGKFGDQLYLEDWPARFTGVRVLDHVGGGVAPWNHGNYRFSCDASGRPLVDGNPVIFYHFHAFTFLTPDVVMPARDLHYPLPVQSLPAVLLPI